MKSVTRQTAPFRWEGVPLLAYKQDGGTHFKGVTRQVLDGGNADFGAELRYFEIEPGGHSTLERHLHQHLVLVVRGGGACLVGDQVHALATHDVVHVPPETWHQFRATQDEPLGFLCLVRRDRDRPRRPGAQELDTLRANPDVARFIRV